MSAPDVNIEKQKKRHGTMVLGLWTGLGIALLVAIAAILMTTLGTEPTVIDGAATQGSGG